jgi:hypothetical protein
MWSRGNSVGKATDHGLVGQTSISVIPSEVLEFFFFITSKRLWSGVFTVVERAPPPQWSYDGGLRRPQRRSGHDGEEKNSSLCRESNSGLSPRSQLSISADNKK